MVGPGEQVDVQRDPRPGEGEEAYPLAGQHLVGEEQGEAAQHEGGGRRQRWRNIVAPLARRLPRRQTDRLPEDGLLGSTLMSRLKSLDESIIGSTRRKDTCLQSWIYLIWLHHGRIHGVPLVMYRWCIYVPQ